MVPAPTQGEVNLTVFLGGSYRFACSRALDAWAGK